MGLWTAMKGFLVDAAEKNYDFVKLAGSAINGRWSAPEQAIYQDEHIIALWLGAIVDGKISRKRVRETAAAATEARNGEPTPKKYKQLMSAIAEDGQAEGITENMNNKGRGSNDEGADETELQKEP